MLLDQGLAEPDILPEIVGPGAGKVACDARQLAGRTENNRWVNFDGPATLIGRYVDVTITEAMPNSLRGRLAAAERGVA